MSEEDWRLNKALETLENKYNRYLCSTCHTYHSNSTHSNICIPVPKQDSLDSSTLDKEDYPFIQSMEHKAHTEVEEYDLTEIPFIALKRLGKVFKEGHVKYGKGNWKLGINNKDYQLERANHALKHLYTYIETLKEGTTSSEDDLAKVMWFCVTQMYLESKKVDNTKKK